MADFSDALARTSVVARAESTGARTVKKVPFVELVGGRVQGVVSSGSDIERVYVSFIERGGAFYCSTNNNRPCGGLSASPCKHILEMVDEGMIQFGGQTVADYLQLERYDASTHKKAAQIPGLGSGGQKKEPAGIVFSRFLNYLRWCELPAPRGSILEMSWFV